ncbi:MAG: zinc-binding alcohol dehydrogenase family protein [Luteolibacter sp.]|uniref:zinc-binding alcohol dehydrogenase family protein n=1 Tax=Luteolibacter sp. TaxID=1962973 RepID=UPI003266DA67
MKAIGARQFFPFSDPGCLVEFETAMPEPRAMNLRVKVLAVSVNPVDTKVRKLLGEGPHDPPRVLGFDAAGIVESVGAGVTGFSAGDEVFYSGDVTRAGSNSEFHSVDARLVAKKPSIWSFSDAAALPLVALTAWELLFERMGIRSDGTDRKKEILVINGAGGVGSALIPLARSAGLRVVATASRPETVAWCKSLGADEVINHREPLRPQAEALGISDFPYIANLHDTESYWETTADLLAPLGTLGLIVETKEPVHIGNPFRLKSPRIVWEYMPARSRFQTADMHVQGEILAEIARRCDAGDFPKITTRTFDRISVANLREAHAAMEAGSAHGKWVLSGW